MRSFKANVDGQLEELELESEMKESQSVSSMKSNKVQPQERLNQRLTQEQVYPSMYNNVKVLSFPAKLHAILERRNIADIVSWMPHGRAWRVHKPKAFESQVIPMFFVQCKYSSFIRQANGWGFRRITKGLDRNAYYHEFFLRGRSHLCRKMRRPATSAKVPLNPGQSEPDFYKMSEIEPLSPDVPPSREAILNNMVNTNFRLSDDSNNTVNGTKWNIPNMAQGPVVSNKISPLYNYPDQNRQLTAIQSHVSGSHHVNALLNRFPSNKHLSQVQDTLPTSLRGSRQNILEQHYAAEKGLINAHSSLDRTGTDLPACSNMYPMMDDVSLSDQLIRHRLKNYFTMSGNQREQVSMYPPRVKPSNPIPYRSPPPLEIGTTGSLNNNQCIDTTRNQSRELELIGLSEYLRSRRMNLEALQIANSMQFPVTASRQRNETGSVPSEFQQQLDMLLTYYSGNPKMHQKIL